MQVIAKSSAMRHDNVLPTQRSGRWVWVLLIVIVLAGMTGGTIAVRQVTIGGLEARAAERLALYQNSLFGQLKRFEYLPSILSSNEILKSLLATPETVSREQANRFLERVKHESGAAEIFLMDVEGTAVASSNWRSDLSFVGHSYRFRPYFQQAMKGRLGRYFAIGATTGIPGGFFARPVVHNSQAAGVVVVKIDLDDLQAAWSEANENVLVSDGNGVIFLSSRDEWRYRSLSPLNDEALQSLTETRQYADRRITSLGNWRTTESGGSRMYEVNNSSGGTNGRSTVFLVRSVAVPGFDWHLHVLMNLASVRLAVQQALLLSFLLGGLVIAVGLWLRQRRAYLRSVVSARDELEQRVQQRTQALEDVNRSLRNEINERERAEQELHLAHAELVQAGKLAAMGRMAAVIVHELNQPLDAIRTFAASAGILAEKNRGAELQETLRMIRQLTERMEKITGQLRSFARKDSGERHPVLVQRIVQRALLLLDNRLRQSEVKVDMALPSNPLYVAGEEIQMEQVMINLLRNAVDAMADSADRRLAVTVDSVDSSVVIKVTDTGTGIPADTMPHLFEPFYSTKSEGDELGLGLALCYNVITSYGGNIRASNNPEGGATFEVSIAACVGESIGEPR